MLKQLMQIDSPRNCWKTAHESWGGPPRMIYGVFWGTIVGRENQQVLGGDTFYQQEDLTENEPCSCNISQ